VTGTTRGAALAALRAQLTRAGFDTAALDARLLLLQALDISQTELMLRPDVEVTGAEAEAIEGFAERRLAHEPVARIIGEREFWGLPFMLSKDTLIPRPDTETLVQAALDFLPAKAAPRLLDLGTGTGCILIALLHERRDSWGIGVDLSPDAAATASVNAFRNGVRDRASFMVSRWADALFGRFDLIVSNPPYIRPEVIASLDREVRDFDPRGALDGGSDGLEAYRAILHDAPRLMTPEAVLALEIGYDQEEDVVSLARESGFSLLTVRHDLGGHPRAVALKRS
jgi:release factor glutamine methyltransferase